MVSKMLFFSAIQCPFNGDRTSCTLVAETSHKKRQYFLELHFPKLKRSLKRLGKNYCFRLIPSRYKLVLGAREDWTLGRIKARGVSSDISLDPSHDTTRTDSAE